MKTLGRLALMVFLCGVALAYLYQHHWSMRVARELDRLERDRLQLVEETAELRAEVERLSGFARLESIWEAAGRPGSREPTVRTANREPGSVRPKSKAEGMEEPPGRQLAALLVADTTTGRRRPVELAHGGGN